MRRQCNKPGISGHYEVITEDSACRHSIHEEKLGLLRKTELRISFTLVRKMLILLSSSLLLTGCVRYKVTLTNGNEFTTRGKPKLDKATSVYRYKDSQGKPSMVPALRVREIEAL